MERPGRTTPENVYKAFYAVLELSESNEELKNKIVAVSGFGTGVGMMSYQDAAEAMFMAYNDFYKK
jgi:O-acetyl-ADP-ribose deacetylase (regulator of RNase III)